MHLLVRDLLQMWMSVPVENFMTVTIRPTVVMCLVHFAVLVLRATGTLGLGILIAVVVNVKPAPPSTAVVVESAVTKQGSQCASKTVQLVFP
jgi:hypothetical protein